MLPVNALYKKLVVLLMVVTVFSACTKEYSLEDAPVVVGTNYRSWVLTGNDSLYTGCIDTAFYGTAAQVKTLTIRGSDSLGNSFQTVLTTSAAIFQPGLYTLSSGNVFSFRKKSGEVYAVGQAGTAFSLQVNLITDSIIEATFSGTFKSQQGETFEVENGAFRALIGKKNPCGNISGTVNPPPSGSQVFKFTEGGTEYTGGAQASLSPSGTGSVLTIGGMTTQSLNFSIVIEMSAISVTTGNYLTATPTSGANSFLVTSAQSTTVMYQSNASTPGVSMVINLTAYDPVAKEVQGTFAGMARKMGSQNVPITNGSFKAVIQ